MVRAVFPGRFDPIHYGHIDIAERASKLFDELIVAVYNKPLKNLVFSPKERIALVEKSFQRMNSISVIGYSGLTVDLCNQVNAAVIVRGLRVFSDFEYEFRMALANKRLSKDIEVVALITNEEHSFLSSSTVKEIAALNGDISSMVPKHVVTALKKAYKTIKENDTNFDPTSLRD